jgi:hypothetical protein
MPKHYIYVEFFMCGGTTGAGKCNAEALHFLEFYDVGKRNGKALQVNVMPKHYSLWKFFFIRTID